MKQKTFDELAALNSQINTPDFLRESLDLLVQDLAIQKGIEDARTGHNLQNFDRKEEELVGQYKEEFKKMSDKNYEKFLKQYELSKSDMETIFHVFARYHNFKNHLLMWSMSPLEIWLSTIGRKRVIYPEWAAMMKQSNNTFPEHSWIFKWSAWETNIH